MATSSTTDAVAAAAALTTTTPVVPATQPGTADFAGISNPAANYFDVLAEQLHLMLSNGDPSDDSSYDLRELNLILRQADTQRNNAIRAINADKKRSAQIEQLKLDKESYFEDMKAYYEQGGTSEPFIVAFPDVALLLDGGRGQYYFILPDAFLAVGRYQNLPSEQHVLVEAMLYKERFLRQFIPLTGNQNMQAMGLWPGGLQGNTGYQREGKRVYLYPDPGTNVVDKKVLVKVVIRPPGSVLLSDPGYLPVVGAVETLSIAAEIIQHRGLQDKRNDGNPQTK